MRKFIIGLILVMVLAGAATADINVKDIREQTVRPERDLAILLRKAFAQHNVDIASMGTNRGTGKLFYVDSNAGGSSTSTGTTPASAWPTLDDAFDSGSGVTANRGDVIYVVQDHAESGSAANLWDIDIAGVTVVHLGNGDDQGTYTFADTDTTVSVGAANVLIVGGRLLAGISEVVIGFDVTADADNLTVIDMEFPEPTTSTFEFNIAVQLVTGADDVSFIGCTAYSADATGADHWFNGGAGVVNRLTLACNKVHGEYAIAPIFSDQVDLEVYIQYNTITQLTASQFAIEYTAAATGVVSDNRINSTVLFEVDPGSMAYWENMEGDTLPEGVSLNGQLGAFTGPAAGAAQDDNAKASLDLAHTDLDAIIVDGTEAATQTTMDEKCILASITTVATGEDVLFTVAGGPIKIIEIVGIVTGTIQAQSTLINYNVAVTAPAGDVVFGTDGTALEINADAVGTLYTWNGVIANDLLATTSGVALGMASGTTTGLVVPPGDIELSSTAASTGTIEFSMRYQPLDEGVTVTAP